MRTLCDEVANCLNNADVLGRVLWLAKYSKGKLVLKVHKITPRTGCSSHAEPSPGKNTYLVRHWLNDETNVRGVIQVQMGDPRRVTGKRTSA